MQNIGSLSHFARIPATVRVEPKSSPKDTKMKPNHELTLMNTNENHGKLA